MLFRNLFKYYLFFHSFATLSIILFNIKNCISSFIKWNILIFIGHIQIAQVPDRNEPDTPGEINYKYVLSLLETLGYNGYIGLEYRPKLSTVEGLKWIKTYGYTL